MNFFRVGECLETLVDFLSQLALVRSLWSGTIIAGKMEGRGDKEVAEFSLPKTGNIGSDRFSFGEKRLVSAR